MHCGLLFLNYKFSFFPLIFEDSLGAKEPCFVIMKAVSDSLMGKVFPFCVEKVHRSLNFLSSITPLVISPILRSTFWIGPTKSDLRLTYNDAEGNKDL